VWCGGVVVWWCGVVVWWCGVAFVSDIELVGLLGDEKNGMPTASTRTIGGDGAVGGSKVRGPHHRCRPCLKGEGE
jgi:hypothetical protein